MKIRAICLTILVSVGGGSCGDGTAPPPAPVPGFKLVSQSLAPDTVLSVVSELVRLELRDAEAKPAKNVAVKFVFPAPRMMFACAATVSTCNGQANGNLTYFTDTAGIVSIRLQHSRLAGTGTIDVSAEALGMTTSLNVVTLPGNATGFAGNIDTAVYTGVTYALAIQAVDQFGNKRSDAVTFTSLTPAVATVSGSNVTAVAVGRGSFRMSAGSFERTGYVSVPPPGRLVGAGIPGAGGLDVTLLNTDGRGRRFLFRTPGHVSSSFARFHPDGQRIVVFETGTGGRSRLFTYDTATLARKPIVDTVEFTEAVEPTFPASGARVYFNGTRAAQQGIYRVEADGSAIQLYLAGKAFGVVSPDESSVLVGSGGSVVRRMIANGTETPVASTNYTPFWSPAGDMIAYVKPVGGVLNLYVVKPDGTGDRLLATNIGMASRFSPDGQWIAIARYPQYGVDLIRVSDGLRLPIAGTGDIRECPGVHRKCVSEGRLRFRQ